MATKMASKRARSPSGDESDNDSYAGSNGSGLNMTPPHINRARLSGPSPGSDGWGAFGDDSGDLAHQNAKLMQTISELEETIYNREETIRNREETIRNREETIRNREETIRNNKKIKYN